MREQTYNARSFFITKTEKVATVSVETNIALGPFVNSTQLLFRVMGAPPCHNNSLKEKQFNVNNIFSICLLMKTFPIHRENCFSSFSGKKGKSTIERGEEDELITSSEDCSQRQGSISPTTAMRAFGGGTHPSAHFCIFQRGVTLFSYFDFFRDAIFHKELLRASCTQLTDLHGPVFQ